MIFCSRFHELLQRGNISVKTGAYILYIKDENVYILQVSCSCLTMFTIKGYNGQPGAFIFTVAYFLTCVGITSETMFRTEYFLDMYM